MALSSDIQFFQHHRQIIKLKTSHDKNMQVVITFLKDCFTFVDFFLPSVFLLGCEQAEWTIFLAFFSAVDFSTACTHNLHLEILGHISVSGL